MEDVHAALRDPAEPPTEGPYRVLPHGRRAGRRDRESDQRRASPASWINLGGTPVADVCKVNIDEAVSSIYLLNCNILQALKEYDALDRYVYASSSMAYGDFPSEPPDEDSPKRPKDPYGAIKLGGEALVESFHRQFDLPFVIIRPSAVYGPLDSNMRVTGIFMLNAHLGKPLRVNNRSEQLDFTYVEDTADGIVRARPKKRR